MLTTSNLAEQSRNVSGIARNRRAMIDARQSSRYVPPVAANSAARRENRLQIKAHKRPTTMQALFLCLLVSFMAAARGQVSAWPGSFIPGFSPRVQSATLTREKVGGGSSLDKGADAMSHRHTPSTHPSRQAIALIGAELIAYRINRQPEQRTRLLGLVQMATTLGALSAADRAALAADLEGCHA